MRVLFICIWVQALATACEAAAWKFLAHNNLHTITNLDVHNSSTAGIDPKLDKIKEKLRQDAHKTYSKAKDMKPHEMLKADMKLMVSYLFPGRRPSFQDKRLEMLVTLLGILWFIPFRKYIYVCDVEREAQKEREEGDRSRSKISLTGDLATVEEGAEGSPTSQISDSTAGADAGAPEADLVIVCYNPACKKYTDSDTLLPRGWLKRTLISEGGKVAQDRVSTHLPRSAKFLGIHNLTTLEKTGKKLKSSLSRSLSQVIKLNKEEEAERHGEDTEDTDADLSCEKNFGTVRAALVQDLYELLPKKGYNVTIFNSIDRDELFLCITLRDEEVMKHALTRHNVKLQLQPEVVEALGIVQPADEIESSPPYIKYDGRLAPQVLGKDATDLDFYRVFPSFGSSQTIMMSTDRIRSISKYLGTVINLDVAVRKKLIVGWFPAHTKDGLVKLNRDWANYGLMLDFSFIQPLSLIREYFGSRIAFMFAWNGCYCKMLLALVPVSMAFELANLLAMWYGKNNWWNRRSLFGYAIVLAVWTRLASNQWSREQRFLSAFWELRAVKKDAAKNPDFFGTMQQSPIDARLKVKAYPKWKFDARQAVSWLITAAFCTLNTIVLILWIDMWQGRLSIGASIVLAVLIQIFTQIFNVMAEAMTDAENHELQLTYYNSYLLKMFVFQFVNQYSSFFYIAVKQQFTAAGCPRIDMYDNDCIGLLNMQLPVTLAVIVAFRPMLVGIALAIVKFGGWYEDYQMKQQGLEKIKRSFLEEQGKFAPFGVPEQVEALVQLALTVGFILIFGGVAPRIALLCLIVFMVQLRAGAVILTTAATRTVPRQAMGVGHIGDAMNFLNVVGMAFSGYMLVNFAPLFRGTMILTRVSAWLFWGLFVCLLWFFVDMALPPRGGGGDLLDARRAYVEKKVGESHSDAIYGMGTKATEETIVETEGDYANLVGEASWDDIPRLIDIAHGADAATPSAEPQKD